MTDDWRLVIEHADGSDDTELNLVDPDDVGDSDLPSLSRVEIDERLHLDPDETYTAELAVYADAWRDIEDDIDRIDDRVVIYNPDDERRFGGRIRDDQYQSSLVVSVLLDGAKRDAIDAEASGPNQIYDPQPDDDVVAGILLPRIPTIDAGTIERTTDSVAFEESRASPGKSITKLAEATGAEYRFTPEFELEWLEELGEDRSTVLRPGADSVIGEPTKERDERELATHVTVLGAGEGTAQVEHTVAIDESTDREIHRKHPDKDIQREERAEAIATQLADEIEAAPRHVDLTLDIAPSVQPGLGDRFPVDLPAFNVDDEFRVVERKRILDDGGDRYRCRLSNRKLTRESAGEAQAQSIDEFREGNAGQYFFNSDSEGYEPIDDGEPFEFSIPYPEDVIREYDARLRIRSQAYRRRVVSDGHSHQVTIPDHSHSFAIPDHNHEVTVSLTHAHGVEGHEHGVDETSGDNSDFEIVSEEITNVAPGSISGDSWETVQTWTSIPTCSRFEVFGLGFIDNDAVVEPSVRLVDTSSGGVSTMDYPVTREGDPVVYNGHIDRNVDEVELQMRDRQDSGYLISAFYTRATTIGRHNHDVDGTTEEGSEVVEVAQVVDTETSDDGGAHSDTTSDGGGTVTSTDETSDLVSGIETDDDAHVDDVTVVLGGEPILEDVGDGTGPINETVDITGLLDAGRNPVEVTSASLGEVWVGWEFDGIRNGGSAS